MENLKDHLSIVFIGHVDAGKSSIVGNILYLTGEVDERTIEKLQIEANEKAGFGWYFAFITDTSEEEREKGKTVEVGHAHFQTSKRRFTILDAPGHKNYVPNMIAGVSQADVGILVISARKGEFETGFDRGGQTREHTILAKSLGIQSLVVVINKMDDKTVCKNGIWEKDRYDEIVGKLSIFFKQTGFKRRDIIFLPISAITGQNIKDALDPEICSWYKGLSLIETLENLSLPNRNSNGPLRIPILDKIKESGKIVIHAKVESGTISVNQKVIIMPSKKVGYVTMLSTNFEIKSPENFENINSARPGESIKFTISDIDEESIHTGFVVCTEENSIRVTLRFEAKLIILDTLAHKPIISPGYQAIFHCHTIVRECELKSLQAKINKKTGKPEKSKSTFAKKGDVIIARFELVAGECIETYENFPQLGSFTLRDEGKTIACGTIEKLGK